MKHIYLDDCGMDKLYLLLGTVFMIWCIGLAAMVSWLITLMYLSTSSLHQGQAAFYVVCLLAIVLLALAVGGVYSRGIVLPFLRKYYPSSILLKKVF